MSEELELQLQKYKEKRADCLTLESELKTAQTGINKLQAEKILLERKFEKERKEVIFYKEL